MTRLLPIELFVNTAELYHSAKFEGLAMTNLLGKELEQFLDSILTDAGVGPGSGPVLKGKISPQAVIEGRVYVAEGAEVGPTAFIQGPTWIGPDAEVRHGAFIRGKAYIGPRAVVGHATEVKGSVFLDDAKAGHFAYVGDSVLGRDVNLGAGTKLANLKLRGNEVRVRTPGGQDLAGTGLRKMGAIIGDTAQTGCNAVLSPGTLLLPGTLVMPCFHYHGTLEKGTAGR